MAQPGSGKTATNRLVGASCAAVLAIYTAGYARTQSAADRLSAQVSERRASARPAANAAGHVLATPSSLRPTTATGPAETPSPEAAPEPVKPNSSVASAREPNSPATVAKASNDAPPPVQTQAVQAAPEPAPQLLASASLPAAPAILAPEIAAPPPVPVAPAPPRWKDGTYTGWGYSRHGNIEARVVIEGGRITSATISQCLTRYSCSVIDPLPPEVAQRQSPEVDYVSGATQSADAFYGGVVEALKKAK